MKYLYKALDKPTRLYIKQCPHCGLKYFGKTTKENVKEYKGSGVRWTRHLKKHKVESVHLWNSDWYYDKSIARFALKFSRINKIVESKNWANLKDEDGLAGGDAGTSGRKKISDKLNCPIWKSTKGKQRSTNHKKTISNPEWLEKIGNNKYDQHSKVIKEKMNDPSWKKTIGQKRIEKMIKTKTSDEWKNTIGNLAYNKVSKLTKETKNNIQWKETIGKSSAKKQSQTLNSQEWKNTVGQQKLKKIFETKNKDEWKETVGKEWKEKLSKTRNDPIWLETVGKEMYSNLSKLRKSKEFKEKYYKTCPHCNKGPMNPGNYSKYHGDKCKERA